MKKPSIALVVLLALPTPSRADQLPTMANIIECKSIAGSISRLNCYDQLFRGVNVRLEDNNFDSAFEVLRNLVEYSRDDEEIRAPYAAVIDLALDPNHYLVAERLNFKDCFLVSEQHWMIDSVTPSYINDDAWAKPRSRQRIKTYVRHVQLGDVDLEKTRSSSDQLIMKRGKTFLVDYRGREGWTSVEELRVVDEMGDGGYRVNTFLRPVADMEEVRSGLFILGRAFPEDVAEIRMSLYDLVQACSSNSD